MLGYHQIEKPDVFILGCPSVSVQSCAATSEVQSSDFWGLIVDHVWLAFKMAIVA